MLRLHVQALLQVVMMAGIIKDTDLRKYYMDICIDLGVGDEGNAPFSDVFNDINLSLKPFYFEIKTVVVREYETNQRVYYHGFTNTQDDAVAKNYGGKLTDKEVTMYRHILDQLVVDHQLSTADVALTVRELSAGIGTVRNDELQKTLQSLLQQGWLERNDRNFWEVGPRAYLELRGHIEGVMRANLEAAALEEQLAQLPQILFY